MLNKLKHTIKQTAIYSFGNISSKLIGFVLLPIYAKNLSIGEYGVLAYLETTSLFFIAVLALGLPTALIRWCSQEKSKIQQKSIIFTIFTTIVFVIIISNCVLFPFRKNISVLLFNSTEYESYFTILFIQFSIEIVNQLILSLIRLREKSILYMIVTITKFMVTLLFNIYFVVYKSYGVKGILLSQLIGGSVLIFWTFPLIIKNIRFNYNFRILSPLFKYSYPLIFATVSTMLLTLSDRYIIEYYLDFSDLGVYSLGYKFAGLINVFILQSFQLGFLPIAFKIFDKPEAKRFFSKVMTYFVLILCISALTLSLFSKEAIILFSKSNSDFWSAYKIVPLLTVGLTLKGIQYILLLGFHFVKKTYYNAIIVLIGAGLSIGLNILFIPAWEIYGAAYTAIIANTVMLALYFYFSQKYYPVNYEYIKILKLFVLSFALYFISRLIKFDNIYLNIILKIMLLISMPLILRLLNFYEKIEMERILQFWKKWKNIKNWKFNIKGIENID